MLGIDINETQEISIDDAKFKIGVLPYGIRIRLDSLMLQFASDTEAYKKNIDKVLERHIDVVKYGVKGHSNIKDKAGKDISFKSVEAKEGNRTMHIVSDETLDMYLVMGIIPKLADEVTNLNTITKAEIKN